MQRPLMRPTPALPVEMVKSYVIASPRDTHTRPATCDEVGCKAQTAGWQTFADESTRLGQRQAHYIRKVSGRRFTEQRDEFGRTVFTFPAGQQCFADHRVSIDRPEIFAVKGGDHRGNPRGTLRVHDSPTDWVEDFAEHQDRLKQASD